MRWPNNDHKPSGGETRINRRFAWKPIVIGQWEIWLEYYEITEQYIGDEWVELEKKLWGSRYD